eukprot:1140726-Pyramimonas_sp.AAC.1
MAQERFRLGPTWRRTSSEAAAVRKGLMGHVGVVALWFKNGSRVVQEWLKSGSKVVQEWFKRGSKVVQE